MRKSLKIAPGVRLNVSKSGVGASIGGRGGRYSVHSSGRHTVSAGSGIVPGVYYQKSVGGSRSRSGGTRSRPPAQQAAPPTPKKPGLFAPKGEKQLYKAVKAQEAPFGSRLRVEDFPYDKLTSILGRRSARARNRRKRAAGFVDMLDLRLVPGGEDGDPLPSAAPLRNETGGARFLALRACLHVEARAPLALTRRRSRRQ
jgi:hypothetical protein